MSRKQSHGKGYRLIIRYLGITSILVGVALLLPLLLLPLYPQEAVYAKCFLIPGIPAVTAGYLVYRFLKEDAGGRLKRPGGDDRNLILGPGHTGQCGSIYDDRQIQFYPIRI